MTDEPEQPPAAPEPSARTSPLKCWLYGGLAALVAGGIGYGVAYGQGRGVLSAVQTELESKAAAHERAKQDWDAQIKELRRRIALLGARRTLHSAVLALESSNFGIAQERLQTASAAIARQAGTDAKLTSVATRLGEYRINVTADIAQQRAALNTLLGNFDDAMGPDD